MSKKKPDPSCRHEPDWVEVETSSEYSISLACVCVHCGARGSIFTLPHSKWDWEIEDEEETDD